MPINVADKNAFFLKLWEGLSSLKNDRFKLGIGTKGRIGVEEDLVDPGLTFDPTLSVTLSPMVRVTLPNLLCSSVVNSASSGEMESSICKTWLCGGPGGTSELAEGTGTGTSGKLVAGADASERVPSEGTTCPDGGSDPPETAAGRSGPPLALSATGARVVESTCKELLDGGHSCRLKW